MNVAPSVVSSAGAPGAGATLGTPAAAAPPAGSSFADVLRQLSGQDGALGIGDGAAAGERGTPAFGAGRSARTGEGGESETTDGATAAADDPTMGLGTIAVPVAVTLTPPLAPPAEAPAATGGLASDDGWGHAAGAAITGTTMLTAATAATVLAADVPVPAAGAAAGARLAVAEFVPVDGGAGTKSQVTTPSGGAADVGAPASRAPGERGVGPAAPGLALGHPDEAGQGRAVSRLVAGPAPAGRTEPVPAPTAIAAAVTVTADAAALMTVASAPVAPEAVPAATPEAVPAAIPGPPAAAVITRVTNEPAREVGRALGLPRALDAVPAAAGEAPVAAVAAAVAIGAPELDAAAPAPVAAAVGRGQHPALAAALRAFQQAGAPAAGGESVGTPPPVANRADGQTAATPVAGARSAALAGAAADAVSSAVEADRRPLVMPPIVVPALGGDLRVSGGGPATARAEAAGVPVPTIADGEAVHAQIVQSLRVQWSGGGGEARVRLRPEYLGEVVATVKVEQGTVTATLQAERPEVRRWMEANTQTLRDGLGEHGLKLDRLVVVSEPARGETGDDKQGRARGRQPQAQPQPRPRRPRPDGEPATFDVNT